MIATSILPLSGCGKWMIADPSTPPPSEVTVLAELGVITPKLPQQPGRAKGPSLVAGDGVALQWAAAHGVIAARDAGPWTPAMLVLD